MSQQRASLRLSTPTLVLLSAGTIAAIAWALMVLAAVHEHTSHGLLMAGAMWMLMMTAMMLPPVLPWLLAYAAVADDSSKTTLFGAGYFTTWAVFAFAAGAAQTTLAQHGALHLLLTDAQTGIGAALLVGAGLYQLLPVKAACLKHCRSPMSFFLTSWRSGRSGAVRMGVEHGAYCVGCCWALMAVAFAVGTMNVVWMAILTLILCIEKMALRGEGWSRLFGAALIIWGTLLAAGA